MQSRVVFSVAVCAKAGATFDIAAIPARPAAPLNSERREKWLMAGSKESSVGEEGSRREDRGAGVGPLAARSGLFGGLGGDEGDAGVDLLGLGGAAPVLVGEVGALGA